MNEIQKYIEEKIEKWKEINAGLLRGRYSALYGDKFFRQSLETLSAKIKSDLLAIADKSELEELRREVENYFRS